MFRMAWYYSQPRSPSPWNSLQAAENYLRQRLARRTYGHGQHLRQVYLRPIAQTYYQQSAAPQYYQPPAQQSYLEYYQQPSTVPQYYQQGMRQYYQPSSQQFYDQAAPQYYEQPMQQYYEQPAQRYTPFEVATDDFPELNWKSLKSILTG